MRLLPPIVLLPGLHYGQRQSLVQIVICHSGQKIELVKYMNSHIVTAGSLPAIFIIESIMDHVASMLGMDPDAFRQSNLYQQGQVKTITTSLSYLYYHLTLEWLL